MRFDYLLGTGRRLRRLAWLAILAWLPGGLFAAGDAPLPPAHDLKRDAEQMRARRIPMLVLFSRDGCQWCVQARRDYLLPMQGEPASRQRVLIREVDVDQDAPLVDFSGRKTTYREFGTAEKARFTPTVILYGPDGTRLADPLVGMAIPDFYGSYLERAVDQSVAKLRR
jgi:hypothetical protein